MAADPDRIDAYQDVMRRLAADARSEAIDQQAVRAAGALERAGVPTLLLRGPVMARWLYDDPAERPYVDIDLLVPHERFGLARQAIVSLGFTPLLVDAAASEQAPHADTLTGPGASIDLHWTLRGIGAPAADVWAAMAAGAEPLELGGARIDTPGVPARLLIVALHAAQHRTEHKPREDLERAIAGVPEAEWGAAAQLAGRLQARSWFSLGLSSVAGGPELMERLDFSAQLDLGAAARAQGRVQMLEGLVNLSTTPGAWAKLRLVLRELFPSRSFTRQWARRNPGPGGLVRAYVRRLFWLVGRLPSAYRAYRRARAASRSST